MYLNHNKSVAVAHPSIQLAVQSNDLPGQLSINRYKLELRKKLIKAKGVNCTRTFPAEHDGRHYVVSFLKEKTQNFQNIFEFKIWNHNIVDCILVTGIYLFYFEIMVKI